ncbi:MAG: spore germination protein [Bacillota bacterium]|jgi:spore germination protein KA/spore germination protein|nr:spore germination protein [Bacillota bacterium]
MSFKDMFFKKDKRFEPDIEDVPLILSGSFEEKIRNITNLFENCYDFSIREFLVEKTLKGCVFFFESLISYENVNRFILKQFMHPCHEKPYSFRNSETILKRFLPVHKAKTVTDTKDFLHAIYSGDCAILVENIKEAIIVSVHKERGRQVGEAIAETTTIGPQEGFVEDISLNYSLLRKRIKTSKFKMEYLQLGRLTKNTIILAYIEGTAKKQLVDRMKKKLSEIDTDGFVDSGHLRRFFQENNYSPFPQEILTERPDRCVSLLLEGRVALLMDGSPFAIIIPAVFIDIIKTADEAYMHYYIAMFIRIIRFTALLISTLSPAVYIALTVFHPGMIPTQLLITIASSRAGIPFPAIAEALIMEMVFELIREASVRIPKPIGPSISIVGGLVIGQSVVEAGIASQAMIIVVALTSITAFAVPGYATNNTLRILRFPFMIAASISGIFGIISLLLIILIHMVSRRSFGIPYLAPFGPLNVKDIINSFLHGPVSAQTERPSYLETGNIVHTKFKNKTSKKGEKNN